MCVCDRFFSSPLSPSSILFCDVMAPLYRKGKKEGKHTDIDVWSNAAYTRVFLNDFPRKCCFKSNSETGKIKKKYNKLILALNAKKEQIIRATIFTLSHHHHHLLLLLLCTTVNSILWQLFMFFYLISMRYPWMPSIWWGWSHSHSFSSYIEAEEAPEGPPFPHLFPYIYSY